jgi:hypothetical protein
MKIGICIHRNSNGVCEYSKKHCGIQGEETCDGFQKRGEEMQNKSASVLKSSSSDSCVSPTIKDSIDWVKRLIRRKKCKRD